MNALKGYSASQAAALGQPRIGVVTSYNANDGTAKVAIQPENTATGWLPVLSHSVGPGWGMHVPLKTGEQVLVLPTDGDADSGVIIGRFYSDVHRPPATAGSDIVIRSSLGATATFGTDGKVTLKDPSGSMIALTNDGNITLTAPHTFFVKCESFNVNASISATIQTPTTNISEELLVGTGPIKQNNITVIVP